MFSHNYKYVFFFFNDTATTEIYTTVHTLSLHDALPISLAPELPATVIRNLADPAASLGADPPGLGPEPAIAEGAELAAVALAKLAALLPAALVLPLSAAEAALVGRRADFARVETADV